MSRLPLVLLLLAVASPALPATAAASDYVPGEVIVRYEDGTTATAEASLEQETGTETEEAIAGGSEQLSIEDGESVPETIAELEDDPGVAYAVPNWRVRAAAFTPNDRYFRRQWNLIGRFGLNMPEAWELADEQGAPGGRGATVAVLDSGVAYERYRFFRRAPDLRRSTFVKGYDFIDLDRHPNDEFGHGTHVTGTIAQATDNKVGLAGIAYRAKIMPLRVLDQLGYGDAAIIARAIRYAARRRVDVINLSVDFAGGVRAIDIPDVLAAMRYARRKGSVVVAAAGNRGASRVAYPARASQAIAVGATTSTGCEARYSNTGSNIDLVAPGGGEDDERLGSPWDRELCRPGRTGRPILQQTFVEDGFVRAFGFPRDYNGTSMATPHVTAVAALVIASGRLGEDPTPLAVEEHLEATARDAGWPGFDRAYGHGLLDAAAALRPAAPAPVPPSRR
jgi:serine protease